MCWNKALTFGVGLIKLSFCIYHCVYPIHANVIDCHADVFNPNVITFHQIAPRVCTLVLFNIYILLIFIALYRGNIGEINKV